MEINIKHNRLSHLAQGLLMVGWILFCLIAFGNRFTFLVGKNFSFFDVLSGSMSPHIPAGSIIKIGDYSLNELREGDIIAFQSKEGRVVVHRINKINKKEIQKNDGGRILEFGFVTKGDANSSTDEDLVLPNQIIGKYKWHIPYLGYLTSNVKTPWGFVAIVVVPGMFLVVLEMWLLVLGIKRDLETKQSHDTTTD